MLLSLMADPIPAPPVHGDHDRHPSSPETSGAGHLRALERTVAEQQQHLDALADRIRYMSEREVELRTMLHAAHAQLAARDETLLGSRGSRAELERIIAERTAWAERMVEEAQKRGRIIDELKLALEQRTAWAERMTAEAEARGRVIEELQSAPARTLLRRILRRGPRGA
jgi:DNA repair exonuclease SbcCD ATPase subunit